MKKIILILGMLIVIASCKKADAVPYDNFNLYFEVPQPINDSELDRFPNKFKGLYMDKDSIFLRIDENVAQYEHYFKMKIHKRVLDSLREEYDFFDGKLIAKNTDQKYDLISKGDSIELVGKNVDTIFRFSCYKKAKRINDKLVLSTRDSIFWKIKILSIKNKVLKINTIYSKKDLKKIDSIAVIKSKELDSISFVARPTRREFKSLLKLKDFGYEQQFQKVLK